MSQLSGIRSKPNKNPDLVIEMWQVCVQPSNVNAELFTDFALISVREFQNRENINQIQF